MIKICRSFRIAAAAAATSLLSISSFTDLCACAMNSTKIVFMMCLLRCIYDVLLCILSTFNTDVCLSSSARSPEIFCRSASSIEVLYYGVWNRMNRQWTSACIDSTNGMKHHPNRLLFILSAFYWDHFQNPAFHCSPFLFV